ncbi:MAG: hypothetical protein LBL69_06220, partial [Zoogloeaceae bacterium]|nr:hypothetical protein [Zoogloeaceae bacterium]
MFARSSTVFFAACAALACFSLSGCGAYVDALARAHSGSTGDWPDLFIVPRDGLPCFYADRSWLVASFTVKEARPGTTVLWEMPARDWQRVSDQPEKCRLFNVDGRATGTLMPGKLYAA